MTERPVHARTERVPEGGLRFDGAQLVDAHLARRPTGEAVYVLNPPAERNWGPFGDLRDSKAADCELTQEDGSVVLRSATGSEIDLLELDRDAAAAFDADRPEAMTIVPPFEALGGARELGRYLVGGRVLTGTDTIKKPLDSTALSLYRIARRRGGPLWDAIAHHVAEAEAARIEALAETDLPHDMWSAGETHVRFVNDALLLMTAHLSWTGADRFAEAAESVCETLGRFTVDAGGGRWALHDSLERGEGRNDFVLNTHLQAVIALLSAGRDVHAELHAARTVLDTKLTGLAGLRSSAGLATVEGIRAWGPRRVIRKRVAPVYTTVARRCHAARALRLPGGWIARDLSGKRAPGRYLTVNLGDLAALLACLPEPQPDLRRHLSAGIGFAVRSGFFRAEIRDATPMSVLVPAVLNLAGRREQAVRAAEALLAAGKAPLPGWPGFEDGDLWAGLGGGAPL